MSFKLNRLWTPLSASMKNNVIDVEDGLVKVSITAPFQNLIFEKQCIEFNDTEIQCALVNDKYLLIFRFDGSISMYLKDTCTIVYNYKPRILEPIYMMDINPLYRYFGGALRTNVTNALKLCYLYKINKRICLFSESDAIAAIDIDENSYYMQYCKTNLNAILPELHLVDGAIQYSKLTKDTVPAKKVYGINRKVSITPEYIMRRYGNK